MTEEVCVPVIFSSRNVFLCQTEYTFQLGGSTYQLHCTISTMELVLGAEIPKWHKVLMCEILKVETPLDILSLAAGEHQGLQMEVSGAMTADVFAHMTLRCKSQQPRSDPIFVR